MSKTRNLFISMFLLLLIYFSMSHVYAYDGPFTNVSKTVYTTTSLNVRSGPSTDYSKYGVLSKGTAINIVGICDNGWAIFDYNGNEGFISGKYISDQVEQPVADTPTVGICESIGASQSWVNKVNAQLAYVPENVKSSFVANGWHIYITTENIAQTYFSGIYNSVRGVTKYDEKFIKVETRNVAISSSIHEMGHYVDFITGSPSLSAEFTNIYNEEVETFKSRIPNSSSVRNQQEFFAETFHYMCKNSSKCTPKAMEFVQRYVNQI